VTVPKRQGPKKTTREFRKRGKKGEKTQEAKKGRANPSLHTQIGTPKAGPHETDRQKVGEDTPSQPKLKTGGRENVGLIHKQKREKIVARSEGIEALKRGPG